MTAPSPAVTPAPAAGRPRSQARMLQAVSLALGVVVAAPIALSSQDLVAWASSRLGLNLAPFWSLLVPIALDLAAAACIGMTVVAVWRRERPGVFGILVWVFAGVSAYAQYRHGITEKAAGRAQDAWWAMPAFALLGPALLEVTLHRIRKWARQDAAEVLTGAAGFGARWLVAPVSTWQAWAVSRREGIAEAAAALAVVTDRKVLRRLPAPEQVLYAYAALGETDPHAVRVWLARRRVHVTQAAIDQAHTHHRATQPRPTTAAAVPVPPAQPEAPARARTVEAKRQPSARDQVIKAHGRNPAATDAQIAARLDLSEATVRRHRRQAVDTLSTTSTPEDPDPATDPADPDRPPATPRPRRHAVDSVSTDPGVNGHRPGRDVDGELTAV